MVAMATSNVGMLNNVISTVCSAVDTHRTEVCDALALAIDNNVMPHQPDDISLIVLEKLDDDESSGSDLEATVTFFHWTSLTTGKRVHLADDRTVKWNMSSGPYMVDEEVVTTFTSVISKAPMMMIKPRDLRHPVDKWVLLVRDHVITKLCSGPMYSKDKVECILCTSAEHHGVEHGRSYDEPLFRCITCLTRWHTHCAEFVGSMASGFSPCEVGSGSWQCPVCLNESE